MKTVEEMLNAPRLVVDDRTSDGFKGVIRMMKWSGTVIASWGAGWEHVSVSPFKKHITPSWEDMCYIKNLFWREEECVLQYHPPKSEYVNNMPNCLHLWKPAYDRIPMPPAIMIGIKEGQSREEIRKEVAALYPIESAIKEVKGIRYPEKTIEHWLEENPSGGRLAAVRYGWGLAMDCVMYILEDYGRKEV